MSVSYTHLDVYKRQLLVIANLSRETQPWQPGKMLGNWQLVMHNYEEASPQPCAMTDVYKRQTLRCVLYASASDEQTAWCAVRDLPVRRQIAFQYHYQ